MQQVLVMPASVSQMSSWGFTDREVEIHNNLILRYGFSDAPCVYIVLNGKERVYVGATQNIQQRITWVGRSTDDFTSVRFVACRPSDLVRLEERTIALLKPRLNRSPKSHYSSNNCEIGIQASLRERVNTLAGMEAAS